MEILELVKHFAPYLAGGTAGYLAYRLLHKLLSFHAGVSRSLGDYVSPGEYTSKSASKHVMGSRHYRIARAFSSLGIRVNGRETLALYLGYGSASVALAIPLLLAGLPSGLILAAAMLGYIGVNAWIENKWEKEKMALEKEIPTLLTRLSSLA